MDRVDVQILARLNWEPYFASHRARGLMGVPEIARDLELHVTTVKRRIQAMRKAGVLGAVCLLPEHTSVGMYAAAYRFDFATPRAKERAVELLRGWGHPAWFSFVGTELWCVVGGPGSDDSARMSAALADRLGARKQALIDRHHWEATVEPSALDIRIMWSMRNDVHRARAEVADECGVTERTVRRRLARLAKGSAFAAFPEISPNRMRGLIPYVVACDLEKEDEARARRFFDAFPEAFWRGFPRSRQPFVFLAARDLDGLDQSLARAYEVPGVGRPRHLLFQDSTTLVDEPPEAFFEALGTR